MLDENSHPPGPAICTGLELYDVWNVQTDPGYDAHRAQGQSEFRIALRTLAGDGRIHLAGGRVLDAPPQSLLLLNEHELRSYHPLNGVWNFWWFVFAANTPLHVPFNQTLPVPWEHAEQAEFEALFSELRRLSLFERALASARFGVLFYRWLSCWDKRQHHTPQAALVQEIVERMHKNIGTCWTVSEMAQAAHLCERHFRTLFARETGKSPKEYYDELRLREARALLSQGACNVAEVAARLNFSSPAHLSKAFKRHYGMEPSRLLHRANANKRTGSGFREEC